MKKNERLREIRKKLLLSQAEMAEKMGLTQSALSAMELGTRNIGRRTMLFLKDKFDINPDFILEGQEPMFFSHKNINVRHQNTNVGNRFKNSDHNVLKQTVSESDNEYIAPEIQTLQIQLENCRDAKKRLEDEVQFLRNLLERQNKT